MDVDKFIRDCANYIGECKASTFYGNTKPYVDEACSASPIEKIFYTAVCTLLETDYQYGQIAVQTQMTLGEICDVWIEHGVEIFPQAKIGPYRVDFVLSYRGECLLRDAVHRQTIPEKPFKKIVVELDGHDFHDRDATQRSYEKRRDRFLQKQGYEVFHYTGADVVADPFGVAAECLARVIDKDDDRFDCPEFGD